MIDDRVSLATGQRRSPAGQTRYKGRDASTSFIAPPRLESVAISFDGKAFRRLQGGQTQQLAADCWSMIAAAGVCFVTSCANKASFPSSCRTGILNSISVKVGKT